MALLRLQPPLMNPRTSAPRRASVRVDGDDRSLDNLRPGSVVRLRLDRVPASAEIAITGPCAGAFRIVEPFSADCARAVIVADAPGLARLAVTSHGRQLFDARILCRESTEHAAARCERAGQLHREQLRRISTFVTTLVEHLTIARMQVEGRLNLHAIAGTATTTGAETTTPFGTASVPTVRRSEIGRAHV